jgi:exopolysaccharide biosynthesis polyprenyl glycosylphosphotransferase
MNLETSIEAAPLWLAAPPKPQLNRAKLRFRLYLSLIALDVLCVFVSLFLASLIYAPMGSSSQWAVVASALSLVYFGVALNGRAYAAEIMARPNTGVLRAMRAFILSVGIVVLAAFYLKASAEYSRGMVAIGSVLAVIVVTIGRFLFLWRAHSLLGGNPYTVALIADGQYALDSDSFSFVIRPGSEIDPAQDCPVMFDRLAAALQDADRVVVACPPERRPSWVRMLKGANIRSEIIAPELQTVAPLALDRCGNMPTMVIADGPLGKFDAGVKRLFDICASLVALILLAPFMLIVAALIKVDSAGPVFFVQTRIGQGNRLFRVFKFRSMRVEQADSTGNLSARRDDDRITSVGRFIRRTSIDELPQLINVLIGDMSIVGPRPHALGSRAENKLFWEVDDRYWHRHAAKPGLTGLAQIRGFRGATDHASDLTNRLQADLEYLHNWSLWRDALIILQTFRVIVHRNAF